jgi:pimeloyl-ACP methyl ester carboxylesterase
MRQVVRLPDEFVEQARIQPFWAQVEAIAHTLPYDARIMGDYSLPADRAASVTVPTLVLIGDASFPFVRETGEALAAALSAGELRTLPDQTHDVAPEPLAAALRDFFGA